MSTDQHQIEGPFWDVWAAINQRTEEGTGQDLKVAAKASAAASKALSDLMALQAKEQADSNENQAFGSFKKAADEYEKVNNLPEQQASSFQIAV